jgi:Tol biopolymer transport system component
MATEHRTDRFLKRGIQRSFAGSMAVRGALPARIGLFVLCALLLLGAAPQATATVGNGKIVFASTYDFVLSTIDPDGSNLTTLPPDCSAHSNCERNAYYPAWSPDGTRLAWSNTNWILTINADGTGKTSLANDTNQYGFPTTRTAEGTQVIARNPTWSPDGTRLAFVGCVDGGGVCKIFTMGSSGPSDPNDVVPVPNTSRVSSGISWSPDGSNIAFAEYLERTSGGHTFIDLLINTVDLSTGAVTQITHSAGRPAGDFVLDANPDWSPDGSVIVFYRRIYHAPTGLSTPQSIYTTNAEGTAVQNITRDSGGPESVNPAWSPDCTKIVYEHYDGVGGVDLYTINSDGSGEATQVTDGTAIAVMPDWQTVAGNEAVDCPTPTPDTTPPVVTGVADRPPDANGWYSSPVTIHWSAVDPDDPGLPAPPDTLASTEGADVSYTSGQACDPAGNCATGSFSVSLDETEPFHSCAAPDAVWHASDVTFACSAGDNLSGLAIGSDASFSLSTSVAPGTETANASTDTHQVCDVAGNCTTAGPIAGNKIDKRAPEITVATPAAGGVYLFRQPVPASFTCTDGGSGTGAPGFCTGTPMSGGDVSTTTPGAQTFTVSSRDAVGNVATPVSRSYAVRFAFGGFNAPLKNRPTYINVVQAGRGVPVPFSLRDFFGTSIYGTFGLNILAGNSPSSAPITCPSATKNNVSQTTTLSGLRYLSASAQYEYDWQTSTSWRGTCRALTLRYRDGTTQVVNFLFR